MLHFGELKIDVTKKLVTLEGEAIHLTPTQYRLLEAMATKPGKLLTHNWLLRKVWGSRARNGVELPAALRASAATEAAGHAPEAMGEPN